MTTSLFHTPLDQEHEALGAKMVAFGGWRMPLHYSEGILAEHAQTRRRAAVFDISHMGEFIVEGDPIETGLDRLLTMDLVSLPVGHARYGMMLNEEGGIRDDLVVFRLSERRWFIVVNAATTEADARYVRQALTDPNCFEDVSRKTGKIDVQGPLSREILGRLVPGVERLAYYTCGFFDLLGERVLISRTGYTGELGYEIYLPWDQTLTIWRRLLEDDRLKPAGLGARDVLRLEMGYSLYGHELSEEVSPLETGLERFVDWNKDFVGKQALEKQKSNGVSRRIVGLLSTDRRAPREGHPLWSPQGDAIGVVTSGGFSPALKRGIGLGFVEASRVRKDQPVRFGPPERRQEAVVASRIFYRDSSLKS